MIGRFGDIFFTLWYLGIGIASALARLWFMMKRRKEYYLDRYDIRCLTFTIFLWPVVQLETLILVISNIVEFIMKKISRRMFDDIHDRKEETNATHR